MREYHITCNLAWRAARLTRCDHAKWEWFAQAGPFRVIKMRQQETSTNEV